MYNNNIILYSSRMFILRSFRLDSKTHLNNDDNNTIRVTDNWVNYFVQILYKQHL